MGSVLICVAAAAYKNGHSDYYGAVELDEETGETVWKFDATQTELEVPTLFSSGDILRHQGFRPSSVERLDNGMTLISGWRHGVIVDEDGDIYDTFTHELFNDVHEIQKTSDGTYVVASTGSDTIIELDEDYNEVWRWHMWEHVPNDARPLHYYPSERVTLDLRDYAFDPYDRFHLNYATEYADDNILASALNYGVFQIDKETGDIVYEYRELDECHNPYPTGAAYVIPESGRDRVMLVEEGEENVVMFDGDLSFVKDADPISHLGEWLVTDTKNDRVLIWHVDEDEPRKEFELPTDSKPYEADYLEGGDSNA